MKPVKPASVAIFRTPRKRSARRAAGRSTGPSSVASLIETCKLNGVEPLGCLADVLTRIINGHPNSRIDDLLPWACITAPELKAVA